MEIRISKKYGDFNLDFSCVTDSKRIGILGASGCGKTMTLKSIAGIEHPDQGRIEIEDKRLFDSEEGISLKTQKRKVGYLFQNYALFPTMTVAQNIACGLGKEPDRDQKVKEMINKFGLKGLENHYPSQLSGGQQQRVALARIMAYKPDVLLLDEPFSAMDSCLKDKLRIQLKNILDDFQGTSILVTHDRDEAYQLCDTLVLMKNGRVVDVGATREIFHHPKNVTSARLTGVKNISKIERVDEHRVRALDWNNILLTTDEKINNDVTHIGIRAHDIYFLNSPQIDNCFESEIAKVIEMPFEWQIMMKNGILVKKSKSINSHDIKIDKLSHYTIPQNAILPLF